MTLEQQLRECLQELVNCKETPLLTDSVIIDGQYDRNKKVWDKAKALLSQPSEGVMSKGKFTPQSHSDWLNGVDEQMCNSRTTPKPEVYKPTSDQYLQDLADLHNSKGNQEVSEDEIENAGKDFTFNMYDVINGEQVPLFKNKTEGDKAVRTWKAAIKWYKQKAI